MNRTNWNQLSPVEKTERVASAVEDIERRFDNLIEQFNRALHGLKISDTELHGKAEELRDELDKLKSSSQAPQVGGFQQTVGGGIDHEEG